jgi:hypothetical protein
MGAPLSTIATKTFRWRGGEILIYGAADGVGQLRPYRASS